MSASEATKKIISPERQLNLPEIASNEPLCVQIETVRLNGQTAVSLVEKLLAMVTNLTAEVSQLKTDNDVLKEQMCALQDLAPQSRAI
jgi:outer membrane murein-binding lipoprotein Lpp